MVVVGDDTVDGEDDVVDMGDEGVEAFGDEGATAEGFDVGDVVQDQEEE